MERKRLIILIFAFLVFLTTAFIFSNSLKNSEESRQDSDVITEVLENVAEKIAPENTVDWNFVVRKSAHLTEFFILGIFMSLLFLQSKGKYRVLYAFLCVSVIACTDEFIQRFTGRGSCFTDVMIDISGASIGIGLILLMNLLRKRMWNGQGKVERSQNVKGR